MNWPRIREIILKKDNYTCQKCSFHEEKGKELEIHHIIPKIYGGKDQLENIITLCSICHHFAPDHNEEFKKYINEKINGKILNSFRESKKSISQKTTFGMERKSKEGGAITKAPLGYKIINKLLVPDPEKEQQISQLFTEFCTENTSLNRLAKKYGLTTNGLKKILINKTYIGIITFAGKTNKGLHQPIISEELFQQVQEKINSLSKNKIYLE